MDNQHIYAMTREGVEEVRALLSLDQVELGIRAARSARTTPTETRENGGAIAILPVFGFIEQRPSIFSEIFGGTSTQRLSAMVRAAAADPNVRATILDVSSGGGSVFGVHEAAADIRAARGSKPIIAVVNSMAASAAYWLASAADEIVTVPSGVSGSVGVYAVHTDISGARDKAGVKQEIISAGENKADAVEGSPLSAAGRKAMQDMVDHFFSLFLGDVAAGRRTTTARVAADYGKGLILTAPAALRAGMVDRVDTLEGTIRRLSTPEGRASAIRSLGGSVAGGPYSGDNGEAQRRLIRARAGIYTKPTVYDDGEAQRRLLRARATVV